MTALFSVTLFLKKFVWFLILRDLFVKTKWHFKSYCLYINRENLRSSYGLVVGVLGIKKQRVTLLCSTLSYVIFYHSMRDKVVVFFLEVYHNIIAQDFQALGRVFKWRWMNFNSRGAWVEKNGHEHEMFQIKPSRIINNLLLVNFFITRLLPSIGRWQLHWIELTIYCVFYLLLCSIVHILFQTILSNTVI